MKAILENTHLLGGKNYQFNLHNALSYHYFGVLEYWDYLPKDDLSLAGLNAANSTKAQQSDSKPTTLKQQKKSSLTNLLEK